MTHEHRLIAYRWLARAGWLRVCWRCRGCELNEVDERAIR